MNSYNNNELITTINEFNSLARENSPSFKVFNDNEILTIEAPKNNLLNLVLYSLYFALPFFIIKGEMRSQLLLVIIYYLVFTLFLWNNIRLSVKIKIDFVKKQIIHSNSDIIGQFLKKKHVWKATDIKDMYVKYVKSKGFGKAQNYIYLENTNQKKYLFFALPANGASLINGIKFINLFNQLIK